MLHIFRLTTIVIYNILVRVFDSVYCLSNPRSPKHVATFGYMPGCLASLFGLKVECREPTDVENYGNAIYIANHQNNYDMVTASNIVQPSTVTVGKRSLLQISFFGQLYWLTGNLLIDRNSRTRAHGIIAEVVNHFEKCRISIWMFPEGTHNHGHGLLPFKTGAFHAVTAAGVPIIPVCISITSNKINPNRLHDDLAIVEMLPPIDVSQYGKDQVCELAVYCRSIAERKIAELDKEVVERGTAGEA